MEEKELWARAYAQFIGEQSGDDDVLEMLRQRATLAIPTQWPASEFEPIREAIRTLFQQKQWIP